MNTFEAIVLGLSAACILLAAPLAFLELRDRWRDWRSRPARATDPADAGLTADEPESSTDEWLEADHYGVPITTANIDVVFSSKPGSIMELPRSIPAYSARVTPVGPALASVIREQLAYIAVLKRDGAPARLIGSALPLSWSVDDEVTIIHDKTGYKFGGPWRVATVASDDLLFGEPLPSKKIAYATVSGFRLGES